MASRKPSTSKCSEEAEKDIDEEEMKRSRKEELKEYHQSLVSSERDKLRNADKIRLRKVPKLGNKPPRLAAIEILNGMFEAEVTAQDISDCQKVPPWIKREHNDLLVTFVNKDIRNYVYNKRTKENKGIYMICDELGEERLSIFKKLAQKYGTEKVYTYCGGVQLEVDGKCHRFLTNQQLKKFEDTEELL